MKSFRRRALYWAGKTLPRRIALVTILVLAVNLGAWVWAFLAFQGRPNLLAIALVVYGLGLRHGVDADHIAAIDNVTRKLMQNGRRPVSVGLYFSLGHSMVVILVSLVVANVTNSLDNFRSWQLAGGTISAIVSSSFLLVIGATNVTIFWSMLKRSRPSHVHSSVLDMDRVRPAQGLLSRLFRPVFQVVEHSWQMLLIGFLFGLGFDTATEVTMFAISATQAAKTASLSALLIFPVLFTAGMSLLESDSNRLRNSSGLISFIKVPASLLQLRQGGATSA